ncbi:hypothetical protein J4Q44_G00312000 [Coregonus suidteri]|uniref:Uncharacterized protein n=1 Tax=Coregonus suidteri TaxID=861788 RepID=A0AAN8QB01_9TELE
MMIWTRLTNRGKEPMGVPESYHLSTSGYNWSSCSTLKLNLNLLTDAKTAAAKKKGAAADQKTSAKAALVHTYPVLSDADPKTFKQDFESKHPKSMVPVLVDVHA